MLGWTSPGCGTRRLFARISACLVFRGRAELPACDQFPFFRPVPPLGLSFVSHSCALGFLASRLAFAFFTHRGSFDSSPTYLSFIFSSAFTSSQLQISSMTSSAFNVRFFPSVVITVNLVRLSLRLVRLCFLVRLKA